MTAKMEIQQSFFANATHTGSSAVRGKGLSSMLKLFEKFDKMD